MSPSHNYSSFSKKLPTLNAVGGALLSIVVRHFAVITMLVTDRLFAALAQPLESVRRITATAAAGFGVAHTVSSLKSFSHPGYSDIISSFRMIPFDGIQISDTTNSLISSLTSAALMAISFYFGNKLGTDNESNPESNPDPNQDK